MRKRKPRAVIDTNIFISGLLSPGGAPGLLIRALRNKRFTLVTSPALLQEFATVMKRQKLRKYGVSKSATRLIVQHLQRHVQKIPAVRVSIPLRDKKDAIVLACALGAKADYLVTGDADLLTITRKIPFTIITAEAFLRSLHV